MVLPQPLSIVFAGTSPFAIPSLNVLAKNPFFRIQAVISQPSRPIGRKQVMTMPAVALAAKELHLPLLQPEKFNKEFRENASLQSSPPDFLIVVSYGQMLSEEVLAWPKIAAINVHASLLPKLRGASPIQHAILQGMQETGVTIQKMAYTLDSGPILAQEKITLQERETTKTLHDTLAITGAKLLEKTLLNPLREIPQNENEATFCRKLTKEDAKIDRGTMNADEIDRHVRALNPWPGVILKDTKIIEGSLISTEESFSIACKDDTTFSITKIQPIGKKVMTGTEFLRGYSDWFKDL